MSLRAHVKACASVCEKDTLVCSDVSVNTSLYTNATSSNCGKFLKLLIPLCDREIRIRTPGKLGKNIHRRIYSNHHVSMGMVKTQKIQQWTIRSQGV